MRITGTHGKMVFYFMPSTQQSCVGKEILALDDYDLHRLVVLCSTPDESVTYNAAYIFAVCSLAFERSQPECIDI